MQVHLVFRACKCWQLWYLGLWDNVSSREPCQLSPCHDLANWLSHYLYFFSFLFFSYLQLQDGAWESITWLCHNVTIFFWCDGGSQMITSQVTVTVCHMTRVTWGPWESKCIATVVKCISSREMSENSIEFSLLNSEQRDSWLNSSHQTLDTDTRTWFHTLSTIHLGSCSILLSS